MAKYDDIEDCFEDFMSDYYSSELYNESRIKRDAAIDTFKAGLDVNQRNAFEHVWNIIANHSSQETLTAFAAGIKAAYKYEIA